MPTAAFHPETVLSLVAALLLAGWVAVAAPPLRADAYRALAQEIVDVALDPGHSSWDVGSSAGGLREHELTLDVAHRVRARLTTVGYTVQMTRETADRVAASVPGDPTRAIETEQRARHAAAGPARAFVSIHFNGHPTAALRGTETYYNGDNRGEQSLRLAAAIHQETLAAIRFSDATVPDRGVREDLAAGKPYGHFFSLRGPFPSALIEVLFLSNPADVALARDDVVREAIAEGISRGIAGFLAEEDSQ